MFYITLLCCRFVWSRSCVKEKTLQYQFAFAVPCPFFWFSLAEETSFTMRDLTKTISWQWQTQRLTTWWNSYLLVVLPIESLKLLSLLILHGKYGESLWSMFKVFVCLILITQIFFALLLILSQKNDLPHSWEVHTFKPSSTMCDHCGTILYGLQNQGLKCKGAYFGDASVPLLRTVTARKTVNDARS